MNVNASSFYIANVKGYSAQAFAMQNSKNVLASVSQNQAPGKTSAQEQNEIRKLKTEDQEVRAHEQAHINAAAGIAVSGAHFDYTTGPDGKRYAIGGDVSIDASPVANDPEATIRKAETIRRAALAPANPSAQDYKVAAQANQMANKARIELLQAQQGTVAGGSKLNVRA